MKKNPHAQGMAGEQNSYLRFRIPDTLKDAFETACDDRSQVMSKVVRHLLEGYCKASDAGDALVAPLLVSGTKRPKKK